MSAAHARRTIVMLALVGAAIAAYLTMVQTDVVGRAWDPVFGGGSDAVLRSSFSKALPFPDAALGLVAYLAEAILGLTGGNGRWERRPVLPIAFDLIGLGLAGAAAGLVLLQAFVVGDWCLLCLCSAAVSLTMLTICSTSSRAASRWRSRDRKAFAKLKPAKELYESSDDRVARSEFRLFFAAPGTPAPRAARARLPGKARPRRRSCAAPGRASRRGD